MDESKIESLTETQILQRLNEQTVLEKTDPIIIGAYYTLEYAKSKGIIPQTVIIHSDESNINGIKKVSFGSLFVFSLPWIYRTENYLTYNIYRTSDLYKDTKVWSGGFPEKLLTNEEIEHNINWIDNVIEERKKQQEEFNKMDLAVRK